MTLEGHSLPVHSLAISKDIIVSGSDDKYIIIWNLENGKNILKIKGHTDFIRSVAISLNNKYIVSGSHDESIKVWDSTGKELKEFKGHKKYVVSVAISLDENKIVSGSADYTVRVWIRESG